MPDSRPADVFNLLAQLLRLMAGEPPALHACLTPRNLARLAKARLLPWVYLHAARHGLDAGLAPDLRAGLRFAYFQQLAVTSHQEEEMLQVVDRLAGAGVEAVLLKGADLRLRLYGDAAIRPMTDLDILVAPADMERSREFFLRQGYRLHHEHLEPRRIINELLFYPPPPGALPVDLHWAVSGVFHYYRLPYDRLRPEAVDLAFKGRRLLALAPEHALLHLCLHSWENLPDLGNLLDVSLALLGFDLDWRRFVQETEYCQCSRPVFLMLRELQPVLTGAAPHWVLSRLAQHRPGLGELAVLHPRLRFFNAGLPTFLRHHGLRAWLSYAAASLWPSRAYLTAVYGAPGFRAHFQHLTGKMGLLDKNATPGQEG
jgi:hypothetical protein